MATHTSMLCHKTIWLSTTLVSLFFCHTMSFTKANASPGDSHDPSYEERVRKAFRDPEAVLAGHDPMNGFVYEPDPDSDFGFYSTTPLLAKQATSKNPTHLPKPKIKQPKINSRKTKIPKRPNSWTTPLRYNPIRIDVTPIAAEAITNISFAFVTFQKTKKSKYADSQFLLNLHQEFQRITDVIQNHDYQHWKTQIGHGRGKGAGLYTVGHDDKDKYNHQRSRVNTFYTHMFEALGLPKGLVK